MQSRRWIRHRLTETGWILYYCYGVSRQNCIELSGECSADQSGIVWTLWHQQGGQKMPLSYELPKITDPRELNAQIWRDLKQSWRTICSTLKNT